MPRISSQTWQRNIDDWERRIGQSREAVQANVDRIRRQEPTITAWQKDWAVMPPSVHLNNYKEYYQGYATQDVGTFTATGTSGHLVFTGEFPPTHVEVSEGVLGNLDLKNGQEVNKDTIWEAIELNRSLMIITMEQREVDPKVKEKFNTIIDALDKVLATKGYKDE